MSTPAAASLEHATAHPLPSNRSFGLLFVVVFALAASWAWWKGSASLSWWIAAMALTLGVTFVAPRLLTPLNRAWMKLAELLHRVVSPLVLGFLFFAVVTPFGLIRRWLGGDPLVRKFEPERQTYWIERSPPGPPPDSFPHQF